MREKIYISGAITSDADYKKKFNKAFQKLDGIFTVLTPLMINAELSWKEYMKIDLAMISVCDAVYMLKDWRASRGAKIEHEYALMNGKRIIYEQENSIPDKTCWSCEFRYRNGEFQPCATCHDLSDYKFKDWFADGN